MDPAPEAPKYSHEPILERLFMNDSSSYYNEAKDYYMSKYGLLLALPADLAKSPRAQLVPPLHQIQRSEMAEAAAILDLDTSETGLFWIAQLLYVLPLPMFWDIEKNPQDKGNLHFTYKVPVADPRGSRAQASLRRWPTATR